MAGQMQQPIRTDKRPVLNATQTFANEIQPALGRGSYEGLSASQNTILVVEDEAFVRNAACDILESEGYRVLRARDAPEAQVAFDRQRGSVQLLLSDVVLPGQSGPALAQDLRAIHPALKTIFISGYPKDTVTRYGLTTGQMSYLPKPFSAESLLAKVRQALESEDERVTA
jgi:two-component system cell cycle sensor histidine kinase/response regulator CckA